MAQKGLIVVVDDEIGPRESLRMILKPLYQVYTAETAQEALACIQRERIDLVTLGMKIPGMAGLDLLKEIKIIRSDIEVVMITGFGTLGNALEALLCGAIDFIQKPFNVAEIITVVSKSMERGDSGPDKSGARLGKIKALLRQEEEKQKWTHTYLGVNQPRAYAHS